MAMGVKLLHIVSDNNLIKVVHRYILSPFERCGDESVLFFLISFRTGKKVLLLIQLPDQSVEYKMSCTTPSVS